jgi:hypothetical protein
VGRVFTYATLSLFRRSVAKFSLPEGENAVKMQTHNSM